MRIDIFSQSQRRIWDDFVHKSKNGTFLFYRNYMDYHRERFNDFSLLVWDKKENLTALLPANKDGVTLLSHGGLTYGGFITDERVKTSTMMEIFETVLEYLTSQGFRLFIYKSIPYIYHQIPAEEDRYALFRFGAALYRRDISTVVIPSLNFRLQDRRIRGARKAQNKGVYWSTSNELERFWPILEKNLQSIYGVEPVHSLTEIQRLRSAFPDNIRLHGAYIGNRMIAGIVVYECGPTAHVQYIASSDEGRSCGALDFLFFNLITTYYKEVKFFDFGKSTEENGIYLNKGLIDFKEGFGGRGVTYDFYKISLDE